MGIRNTFKTVSPTEIECGKTAYVTIGFTAEPDIINKPADIVLLLDKSDNMSTVFNIIQNASKSFIDSIVNFTGGSNNTILGGTKIALVSFSDKATEDQALTNNASILKSSIDSLTTSGNSNITAALSQALTTLTNSSTNRKIIVLISDGNWECENLNDIVYQINSKNIDIYVVGINGGSGINELELRELASSPYCKYYQKSTSSNLNESLLELAAKMGNPGPNYAYIIEKVTSDFKITANTIKVSHGSATLTSSQSLRWDIGPVGQNESELVTLQFQITHTSTATGKLLVNESIIYYDDHCNCAAFPETTIDVICGNDCEIVVRPTSAEKNFTVDSCVDYQAQDFGSYVMQDLGRVLQVNVRLNKVCPNKRIAVAVALYELDSNNKKYSRGLRTFVVTATGTSCTDLCINCINFVVPESLVAEVGGDPTTLCNTRKFITDVTAHYIDQIECTNEIIICDPCN